MFSQGEWSENNIVGNQGNGISLISTAEWTAKDCQRRMRDMELNFNTLSSNGGHGIYIHGLEQVSTGYNNIHDNRGDGIVMDHVRCGRVFAETSEKQNGDGVQVQDSEFLVIKYSKMNENGGNGLRVMNSYDIRVKENEIKQNKSHGIWMKDAFSTRVQKNEVQHNQGYAIMHLDSHNSLIEYNQLTDNCGGIFVRQCPNCQLVVRKNVIARNRCTESARAQALDDQEPEPNVGLWLDGQGETATQVTENKIADNGSDGVRTANAAHPTLRRNNLQDNDGYALNNQDASVTIDAQENWWGDPAGPGQSITGTVNAANWLTAPVDVLAAVDREEVISIVGHQALNTLNLNNLAVMTDTLRISATASQTWAISPTLPLTLTTEGDAWASLPLTVTVPADAPLGAVDVVTITVQSVAHPEQEDTTSFRVEARTPLYLPVMLAGR